MLICDANAVLPLSSADVMGNSGQSWTLELSPSEIDLGFVPAL